ncbi:MAG: VOC family protein [Proteobacteria bacterium]|nr:VOC family protein [Pseudomonadota bacterium]
MDDRFPRAVIDTEELNSPHMKALRAISTPDDMPFGITKIGHVVLRVRDVQKSAEFYTKVLGFRVSDVYPESMMPGNMVFLRLNSDHHGVALVGGSDRDADSSEMHHMAFKVDTLDEVFRARNHLNKMGVNIEFEGRRRAGCQVAVEFHDPDGHFLEIYWGLDQLGPHDKARPPEEWTPVASLEDAIDHAPPGQDMTLKDPNLRR